MSNIKNLQFGIVQPLVAQIIVPLVREFIKNNKNEKLQPLDGEI